MSNQITPTDGVPSITVAASKESLPVPMPPADHRVSFNSYFLGVPKSTEKRRQSTFLTTVHCRGMPKRKLSTTTLEHSYDIVKLHYAKLCDYIEADRSHLRKFLQSQSEACYERCKEFLAARNRELEDMRRNFEELLIENSDTNKDAYIAKLEEALHSMKQAVVNLTHENTSLHVENSKLRAQMQNAREDNRLMRSKLAGYLGELSGAKLRVAECFRLAETADPENMRETLTSIRERCRKAAAEPNCLMSLVAHTETPKTPAGHMTKRSRSTTPLSATVMVRSKSSAAATILTSRPRPVPGPAEKKKSESDVVKKLRIQLKLAQARATAAECRRSELESVFVDCVEQAKKRVAVRTTHRGSVGGRLASVLNKMMTAPGGSISIRYEELSDDDKFGILARLVCNEKALTQLYGMVFPEAQVGATGATTNTEQRSSRAKYRQTISRASLSMNMTARAGKDTNNLQQQSRNQTFVRARTDSYWHRRLMVDGHHMYVCV